MTEVAGTQLARLSKIKMELSQIHDVSDAKQIRDKAEALRLYVKQQGEGLEAQNLCAEIKLRAERKAGELLADVPKRHGARPADTELHAVTPSLADLGVERIQSHRWQRIAQWPELAFEKYIAETQAAKAELTTAGALSKVKAWLRGRKGRGRKADTCIIADLQELVRQGKSFGTVYADPPWAYDNQGTRAATKNHYPSMTVDKIAALPIAELAAKDAHLHLWTTNGFLREAFDIVDAWGFVYKSCFVWVKPSMGIGNYWRVSHEFLLLGVRGRCPFGNHEEMSWAELPRTTHSKKPPTVRERIERVSPAPRLELFGRETVKGWAVWGNEISRTLFNGQEALTGNGRAKAI